MLMLFGVFQYCVELEKYDCLTLKYSDIMSEAFPIWFKAHCSLRVEVDIFGDEEREGQTW